MSRRKQRDEELLQRMRLAVHGAEDSVPKGIPDTFDALLAFERASLSDQMLSAINRRMVMNGMTRQGLARKIGVTEGRISQMLSGNQNLTLRTLATMAVGVGAHFVVDLKEIPDETGQEANEHKVEQTKWARAKNSTLQAAGRQ